MRREGGDVSCQPAGTNNSKVSRHLRQRHHRRGAFDHVLFHIILEMNIYIPAQIVAQLYTWLRLVVEAVAKFSWRNAAWWPMVERGCAGWGTTAHIPYFIPSTAELQMPAMNISERGVVDAEKWQHRFTLTRRGNNSANQRHCAPREK